MTATVLKPTSLAALEKSRSIVAAGPSGNVYRIRPMNLERHALAGGLPSRLRQVALEGAAGIDKVLGGSEDELAESGTEIRDYMDGLVRQVVVEPSLKDVDLDVLPPVDYRWLISIALGEEDRDGEGRRLWGKDPITLWTAFTEAHGCGPDCAHCGDMLLKASAN